MPQFICDEMQDYMEMLYEPEGETKEFSQFPNLICIMK